MRRIAALLVLSGLILATWKPVVRIGVPVALGRLDAWAVHGMSHGRIDGIDPLQVPLALCTTGLALADLGSRGHRTPAAVCGLLVVIGLRVLRHVGFGLTLDNGAWGVLLLVLSLWPYWLSSRR